MAKLIYAQVRLVVLSSIVLVIAILCAACSLPAIPSVGLDKETRDVLDHGIQTIHDQPGQWQTTTDNLIKKLQDLADRGSKDAQQVLAQVQSTYNNALGQTASTAFCGADFIAQRVAQRLQEALHSIDPTAKAPTIVPVVCSTNPSDAIHPETPQILYYGYDFLEFSKTQKFTVDLQYGNGQVLKSNFGFVAIPHNYELTLDLQGVDYSGIDRTQGPQVVLKWGGESVAAKDANAGAQSALSVQLPPPTPTPAPPPPAPPPTPRPDYTMGPQGGWGGDPFKDDIPPGAKITKVVIRSHTRVDSVQIVLDNGVTLPRHGGDGGDVHEFMLDPDEYITAISGRYANSIDSLIIETNKRASERFGGTGGNTDYRFVAPPDGEIIGFMGRAHTEMDAIGVIIRQR